MLDSTRYRCRNSLFDVVFVSTITAHLVFVGCWCLYFLVTFGEKWFDNTSFLRVMQLFVD